VYGARAPTPDYADRTAQLLFGTAAQEGHLRWERQRSPRWEGDIGGFSKWQLESGSIVASLDYLKRRPAVLSHVTRFLFADSHAPLNWLDLWSLDGILWALRIDDNDVPGVLFARLHYFRVPAAIPPTLDEQAMYWKQFYNTFRGDGTAGQYLKNWVAFCKPVVDKA